MGRLEGKVAIVVGAGQTPGDTVSNGRATAMLFAREGARCLLVDRNLDSVQETQSLISAEGGISEYFEADAACENDCQAFVQACVDTFGTVDVLHNNVGIGKGDAPPTEITEDAWDLIMDVNLKSVLFTCKYALPIMREQKSGVITNISSAAAVLPYHVVAYKTSKAGINAYTHLLAIENAPFGIRANVIMPGLMNTPMAIEGISRARGIPRDQLIAERDEKVPLRKKMGDAWDVANAALFLASDEADFITGVMLPVDGGMTARIG